MPDKSGQRERDGKGDQHEDKDQDDDEVWIGKSCQGEGKGSVKLGKNRGREC